MSQHRRTLNRRPSVALAVAGCVAWCAFPAGAMGLGPLAGAAVWGQSLDLSVALRPDADEVLTEDCLTAEVQVGERSLMPTQVRVQFDRRHANAPRYRVQTQFAIDEPVVVVQLTASCGHPVVRRYVLFADPPPSAAAVGMQAAASWATPPDAEAAPPPTPSLPSRQATERPAHNPAEAGAVAVPAQGWRNVALRQAEAVSRRPARSQSPASAGFQRRAGNRPHGESGRQRAPAAGVPRLRLDVLAPQVKASGPVEQALQAVAQAAAAARQSASAASAAADRISRLERTVDQLRAEANNSRAQAELLNAQLARKPTSAASWLLGAAAAGFALLALWLWRRLTLARQTAGAARHADRHLRSRSTGAAGPTVQPPTSVAPLPPAAAETPQTSAVRGRAAPAWPPPAPAEGWVPSQPADEPPEQSEPAADPEPPTLITAVQAAPVSEADLAAREVSIDELLDLEQQAEFFVVLGQDEAAIDLLAEHLRHTGGSSPLPYLKLLEIHRRRGDRNDYERMRARFNHRFNAYAPEWDIDLQSGRLLTDYPDVLSRLQTVWARPQDSMAELEAQLFRTAQGEMFDLPAYRDVLMLYALARDLLDHESTYAGSVDLLLPLPDGSEFSSTAPGPLPGATHDGRPGSAEFQDQPTAPIDLDLTFDNQRPASIFDQLDGRPTPPRVR